MWLMIRVNIGYILRSYIQVMESQSHLLIQCSLSYTYYTAPCNPAAYLLVKFYIYQSLLPTNFNRGGVLILSGNLTPQPLPHNLLFAHNEIPSHLCVAPHQRISSSVFSFGPLSCSYFLNSERRYLSGHCLFQISSQSVPFIQSSSTNRQPVSTVSIYFSLIASICFYNLCHQQ